MKYYLKKKLIPIGLTLSGITVAVSVIVYNARTKKDFSRKFILITIKNVYPFELSFPIGISIKEIMKIMNISPKRKVFRGKREVNKKQRLYEDNIFKVI